MTITEAFDIIYRLLALMGVFAPLAMCAGMRDVKRTKAKNKRTKTKKTGRTGRSKRGPKRLVKLVVTPGITKTTAPNYTQADMLAHDEYVRKRDYKP